MPQNLLAVAVAFAIGLLIGLERGWRQRGADEGARVAGIRTFGLIGLAGGLAGSPGGSLDGWLAAATLLGLVVLLARGYHQEAEHTGDLGVTTEVAAVVTYLLGVLAVRGEPGLAAAGGVVTAGLLGSKAVLHDWVRRIEALELRAVLQLGLISVVVLPVLPNRGYGPWQVLNPYELWLMVVLISAIGFVGHFAVRIGGTRRGLLATGLFGGLASSTALTLAMSRAGRQEPALQGLLAAAVVIGSTTMFPRVLVEVAAVNNALLPSLLPVLLTLTAVGATAALLLAWRTRNDGRPDASHAVQRPFELATAIRFAVLLAAVLVMAEWLRRQAGDAGIYALAVLSGLTDVDAITLSLSRMAREELAAPVAARGILLAGLANTAVKAALVMALCRGRMARDVGVGLGAVLVVGLIWLVLA